MDSVDFVFREDFQSKFHFQSSLGVTFPHREKGGEIMLIKETKDLILRYYEKCNAINGNPAKFDAMEDWAIMDALRIMKQLGVIPGQ